MTVMKITRLPRTMARRGRGRGGSEENGDKENDGTRRPKGDEEEVHGV